MPAVWQRHPRYFVLVGVILLGSFYLLSPLDSSAFNRPQTVIVSDPDLPGRVARSEQIYNTVLEDRKALIKKFGPSANEVSMFPPDKDPWPPYTVWDFFPASFNCPHELERIGALGDGGKWVCGLSRVEHKKDCIIYSVGINYESSFEAKLLERTQHCQIWGYDYSVNAFGPQIPKHDLKRTHFYPYGLSGTDAHGVEDENKMYTLDSLMRKNGHTFIDILKIDIEGWEFDTLTTLVKSYIAAGRPLPFGQLQLEIHVWKKSFPEFLTWWQTLEQAGLRPFMTEPNLVYQNYNKNSNSDLAEYSFINIQGENIFITDPPRSSSERESPM